MCTDIACETNAATHLFQVIKLMELSGIDDVTVVPSYDVLTTIDSIALCIDIDGLDTFDVRGFISPNSHLPNLFEDDV